MPISPYIFTKILGPVFACLRKRGYQSVIYLDDFLLLGSSSEECRANVYASVNLLHSLGFVVNLAKSQLVPSNRCQYLGFIFNSMEQSIAIPPARRTKLLELTTSLARKTRSSIREFASFIGSLVSVCPAVQYELLYTKRFEREKFLALVRNKEDYSARMDISPHLQEDFKWWINIFSNSRQANKIRSGRFVREIFTNASLSGWGASCPDLHDCSILLRIDNTTAVAYINKFGSIQFPHLSEISRQIWRWCENRNIFLFASYIPSLENHIADAESRTSDPDTEWSLSAIAFRLVARAFGPFDIDLFASSINAKCDLYASWFPDPGSVTVDAFTFSWEKLNFYSFPPFILISRVLRNIIDDKATGILELPPIMEDTFPGGREVIREVFRARLVPDTAVPALLASLSESTIKQYSYSLRAWWHFCQRHRTPLYSPSVAQILQFLAQELPKISYSCLNTTRSAISLISQNEIGNHPMIKRFCKGVSVLRPPRPRYNFVWDPAPVIAKLPSIYPYEGVSLKDITKKLILLLALATGHRAQTLSLLRISQISLDENYLLSLSNNIRLAHSSSGFYLYITPTGKSPGYKQLHSFHQDETYRGIIVRLNELT
ncbi:PREDICTED: uncharacterized protein LOC105557096 [Vollenhovia emeryi]|uniref:uncharacterized protein LOC105557096 n=1 Tax=Vollenhovia emeryi TaxID=411798 RepID=UPI0005F4FA2A|nr:PREDICTED: uncharacterized protein LOC105557096 [Vollenhovia emeryi]